MVEISVCFSWALDLNIISSLAALTACLWYIW